MKDKGVMSVFHYQSFHSSPFYTNKHDGRQLDFAKKYAERLVRLLFYDLKKEEVQYIIESEKRAFLNSRIIFLSFLKSSTQNIFKK
ncbi:MAG: hypothetical protein CM15mP65_18160 [Crocinitomicaceae bacterium]|nr:MAG: hypothetical protein CM15mP65_18160 [Crocinitomicaceae bacterium]